MSDEQTDPIAVIAIAHSEAAQYRDMAYKCKQMLDVSRTNETKLIEALRELTLAVVAAAEADARLTASGELVAAYSPREASAIDKARDLLRDYD